MATKQEIINDIRSLYPGAGALCKADVLRYIRKLGHSQSEFIGRLSENATVIDGQTRYLVIDIADQLYRGQAGA